MHFEILVEDQSGKSMLDILLPKIIHGQHTFKVYPYKGIGRIPAGLRSSSDPNRRIFLDQLPRLLRGYGKTFAKYPPDYPAVVIVVCDLDDKCLKAFRQELLNLLNRCHPRPETRFCFAVEEGEAWFLGDLDAVKSAYPKAKDTALNAYRIDSICGTWEKLADAVYPGGSAELSKQGWMVVGAEKSEWAKAITPYMDVDRNRSPSFHYFRQKLLDLVDIPV